MEEDMSVAEYRRLLVGLMEDTPLGRVVEIRSTTDRDRIKNMTVQEKENPLRLGKIQTGKAEAVQKSQ